jgi:hypothetical protein
MAPRRPSRRAKGAAPPPPRGLSPEDDAAATPAHSLRPVKAEGGVGPGGAGAAVLATHRHRSPASATTPAAPLQAPGTPQTSPRHTLLGTAHLVRRPPPRAATTIDDLPDELLLKVSETGRRGAREGGGNWLLPLCAPAHQCMQRVCTLLAMPWMGRVAGGMGRALAELARVSNNTKKPCSQLNAVAGRASGVLLLAPPRPRRPRPPPRACLWDGPDGLDAVNCWPRGRQVRGLGPAKQGR